MKKIILTSVLILTAVLAAQSQVVLTGRITDAATDEPLIGAQVVVTSAKGNGTATDLDGNFRLETKVSLPLTLSVEYIGYRTEEIDVYDDSEPIDIQLTEEVNTLSEVVIIGYGTQKRTQLTGSVTTVSADILENSRQATIDAALSGQVSGLNVTASSGQPGAESHIRIRGGNSVNASNEPLYVVDGFIYFKDAATGSTGLGAIEGSLNPLATINPNDIESIEVLKDVSATAIYGSRGANGVILITTKKGSLGQEKSEINYGYSIGVSRIAKKLELFDASQWAKIQKDYFGNKGGYTDEQIAALGQGTDWQDAVLRDAVQQTHELSITGGTQKNRYAFSFNYTDQDGIILNSGFERYNFHTNTEWELKKGLNFGLNVTFGRSKQSGLTTTESQIFNSSPYSAGITNSFVYALLMPPVVPVYNADGSYNFNNPYEYAYFAIGSHSANPVYDLEESVADNINNYLLSNVWASYRLGGLTLKASVGLNSEKLTQEYFSGAYTSLGLATQGIGGVGNRQTDVWQQEYTASYAIDINDSNSLDALVGYTRQTQTSTYSSIRTNHYTNEALKQYNLGDGSNIYTPNTGISESSLNSFLARVNYSYLDRYNATATFRADNSSRFAKSHRWGYFPSLGLSWNAEKEHFLSSAYDLDYLKVRASAGLVGNQEISDYAFTTSYATGSYAGSSSYAKKNTANDNLRWETTASYNVGVDLGLWHNKVSIVTDVYFKKTSDLLLVVPLGFSAGVSTQLQNVGNVVNKGAELSVNWNLISRKRKSWSISANIAYNDNEITDMGVTDNVIQGSDNQQILRRGEPLGSFYGLVFKGIVQKDEDVSQLPTVNGLTPKAGDLKFEDYDGNGRIDGNDRQILGSVQPKFIYGFSTKYSWRNLDLSASFSGSYGNKVYNALGRRLELTGDSYNVLTTVHDSWTPENGGNTLPLASNPRPFSYIDDRYVQDASYLKLRNVTVSYRLPLDKDFPTVHIYVTGLNLLTLTRYKGYDPEVSSGTDSGAYPSARTILFGTNISF
ncbi:MAG: TonB-dependent receptor [Bacteroidaceae bacterium]|nr:TonB-dependent receptor [Bacteroidaceae bacterium]MBR6856072.1 TonB-dependent receptor [Bacteroidaceae bacterium]